jgi:hypothetical protein
VLDWLERSALRYTQNQIAMWLAEAYLELGRPDRARAVLTPAVERATALGYRHLRGVALRLLTLAAPDDPAADEHLAAAIAGLSETGARAELARACLLAGERAVARRQLDDGRAWLERARSTFEDLGARDEAARARRRLSSL